MDGTENSLVVSIIQTYTEVEYAMCLGTPRVRVYYTTDDGEESSMIIQAVTHQEARDIFYDEYPDYQIIYTQDW